MRIALLIPVLLALLLLAAPSQTALATPTFTVTNTNDSGAGSLREALNAAGGSVGSETITFNIPGTDPGCDGSGVCTIAIVGVGLSIGGDGMTSIDGYTQAGAAPNTNAFGQPINAAIKIALDGSQALSSDGLRILGAGNVVRGLAVYGFTGSGIQILGDAAQNNQIEGNFLGVSPSGASGPGGFRGVELGALLQGDATGAIGNTVGGAAPSQRNLISANLNGLAMRFSTNNTVEGNYIGTDTSGAGALPNTGEGVRFYNLALGNTVSGNIIAFNANSGVLVDGRFGQPVNNTITGNSIHSNGALGIQNLAGGNTELAPPVVTATGSASGTACANCTVEVFSDDAGQGRIFEGSTVADGGGAWSFGGPVTGPNVTATATDASGNTSQFSQPFPLAGDERIWGDHNCSGGVDPIDSLLTLRHDAGLSANTGDCPEFGQVVDAQGASPHSWGDVDCGGEVTPVDSLKLLRYDAGLSVAQEDGCPLIGVQVVVVE